MSKIHSRSLKKGDKEYSAINKIYQINLNNYRCNEENLIKEYSLRDKNGKKLTEKLQIDQIDIVKAKERAMEEGIKEGIREGKIKTAKNMLSINMSIEDILKVTGISIEEIEKLK